MGRYFTWCGSHGVNCADLGKFGTVRTVSANLGPAFLHANDIVTIKDNRQSFANLARQVLAGELIKHSQQW